MKTPSNELGVSGADVKGRNCHTVMHTCESRPLRLDSKAL